MSEETSGYSLAHPVYLDVPMMLSFLAHIEGGVWLSEQTKQTVSGAEEKFKKGRAALRARLLALGSVDAGAEGGDSSKDSSSIESKTERHHTSASLFNLLYEYLRDDNQVTDIGQPEQLNELRSGQLVELSGEYLGNPIEDVLAFFDSLMPYVANSDEDQGQKPATTAARGKRSGNPATRAAASVPAQAVQAQPNDSFSSDGARLMKRMSSDISNAPVHDLLFKAQGGLEAVVTAASEFYSRNTREYLRAGEFRVVGKVTKIVAQEDSINLTRRTVVGVAGPMMAEQLISSVSNGDLNLGVAQPIVAGPAVQILPMAIFI
ncbi:DUF6414 family protein [Sinomonas humi]|nr:hypothetical protein [Sinomonas humi]